MEIYTLTIRFPKFDPMDRDPWQRIVEVKEDFTLKQLHKFIQKIIEFDDDHLYEFYVGRNYGNNQKVIPKSTRLKDLYPITGVKLYYLFDFGDSWIFEILKSRKMKKEETGVQYPRVIEAVGENPEQYPDYDEDEEDEEDDE